jgi:hypothetical protein
MTSGTERARSGEDPNTYRRAGANVASLDFEIDREGTFARVPGGR